jgi:hypothetical protein
MLMHFYIEIHLFERPLSSSKEISRRIAGMTVYALDHKSIQDSLLLKQSQISYRRRLSRWPGLMGQRRRFNSPSWSRVAGVHSLTDPRIQRMR